MNQVAYCPQCGHQRVSKLRYCTQCRFDFETVHVQARGGLTSLTRAASSGAPAANAESPQPESSQLLPLLTGVAWLIGAAAVGFLAFLQLEYSGFGFADADEARGLALWNGVAAAITAYFGAMAIVSPSRGRMAGGVLWAILNVAWGGYQISQGLTHGTFLVAMVAFALAGILAFAAWSQLPRPQKASRYVERETQ